MEDQTLNQEVIEQIQETKPLSIGQEMDKVIEEKAEQQIMNGSTEDIAAQLFYLYSPKFKQGIVRLSNKALRRLLSALIDYNFNDKEYNHTTDLENSLFQIADRLLQAKYVMMLTVLGEKSTQENIINNEQTKEENNG